VSAADYRAWLAAKRTTPVTGRAQAYREWLAAKRAPEPELEPPQVIAPTRGQHGLARLGETVVGAVRGIPAGVLGAAADIASRVSQAAEPPAPLPIPPTLRPAAGGYRPSPLARERELMTAQVAEMQQAITGAPAGLPAPTTGAALRATRPYRAGVGVGQTVGGFAAAPVTIPMAVGTSALREVRERLGVGPEHQAVQEAIGLAEGMAPGVAGYREYRRIKGDPSLDEASRREALEDFFATQAPGLVGAAAGVGVGAARGIAGIAERMKARMPTEVKPAPEIPERRVQPREFTATEVERGLMAEGFKEAPEGDRAFVLRDAEGEYHVTENPVDVQINRMRGGTTLQEVARRGEAPALDVAIESVRELRQPTGEPALPPEPIRATAQAAGIAPLEISTQAAVRPTSPEWQALGEAERITQAEPPKATRPTVAQIGRKLQTEFVAEFTPLRLAEQEVRKAQNLPPAKHDIARKFELVAGAAGKAEADIIDFSRAVIQPVGRNADDLNTYLFLKRTVDRLTTDPELRRVGTWTIGKANLALEGLKQKVVNFAGLERAAQEFQVHTDRALRLQVESGRMSPEVYDAIKASNDFYAPFKVMKYMDPKVSGRAGTGRPIATTQDLTKAIKGITSEDFQLGNILQASAQQIVRSRILAEKNRAMLALDEVAALDTKETLFRKLKPGERAGQDRVAVHYFKDGIEQTLETTPQIARAIQGLNAAESGLVAKALGQAAMPLRWGATTANMGFQLVNLLFADAPRVSLISRYGIQNPLDALRFPMDFAYGLYTSMRGNFGKPNDLYMDWLRSGAANSTVQRELTPSTFRPTLKMPPKSSAKALARRSIATIDPANIARFANAIEEASKITGLRRAIRIEKLAQMPDAARRAEMDRIATEIRNYSGSPDFLRRGPTGRDFNLLSMFFNARVQGPAADFARLAGKTGGKEAAAAWARLSTAVGIPTLALALLNRSDEYREDYEKVPQKEREDYYMIPRDSFFTDDNGQKVRDYWRIPKREIVKLFGNMIESAVKFAAERDPDALQDFASDAFGNISPISFTGKTMGQRIESAAAGLNPLIKVPLEYGTGRDFYRHYNVVPMGLEKASPELQYRKSTPEVYRKIGAITGQPPVKLEHALRGATAGLATQFLPPKIEGRNWMATHPVLRRFVRSHIVNDADEMKAFEEALTRQTDVRVLRSRSAENLLKLAEGKTPEERAKIISEGVRGQPELMEEIKEQMAEKAQPMSVWDKRMRMLGIASGERAAFIAARLKQQPDNKARARMLSDLAGKGLLSKKVMQQLAEIQAKEGR